MSTTVTPVPTGSTDGIFYAYISNIKDDNTWRFTLVFATRDVADQWWRAVSTSTLDILINNIQRITPQFYTHNPDVQWNIINFFIDARLTALAAPFRGRFFMALENDRIGRGLSIIPTQVLVDNTSGNWFTIRSKANSNQYWYYDESQGLIVVSTTQRTSFKISAPDLTDGTVIIGTDDIVILTQTHGYVTPGPVPNTLAGATYLEVTGAQNAAAFRFKYQDLKSGRFTSGTNFAPGTAVLYAAQGALGTGQWELAL